MLGEGGELLVLGPNGPFRLTSKGVRILAVAWRGGYSWLCASEALPARAHSP